MNLTRLSIQPQVLAETCECYICGETRACYHRDRDFGFAGVCQECSGFVIIAEALLLCLGFLQPTKSASGTDALQQP